MNLNKLINLYKSQRITQEELASKIGMSKTALNAIILGKSDPQLTTVEKIAKALGVPVSYFFDEEESTGPEIKQSAQGKNISQQVKLNDCESRVKILQAELDGLRRELAAKDKIIELLEKQNYK
jgi:transcriptional regulator with XRE-family HTH domain